MTDIPSHTLAIKTGAVEHQADLRLDLGRETELLPQLSIWRHRRLKRKAGPTGAFAIVAPLYSAVGQAGGTGYVAVMGVLGYAPEIIKPAVLAINILVAAIGCVRFHRAVLLSWRACYPFGVLALPFSFVGGTLNLPAATYQPLVGSLLLLAAAQMALSTRRAKQLDLQALREPPFGMSLIAGGAIGLVSGVIGVGGGDRGNLQPAELDCGARRRRCNRS